MKILLGIGLVIFGVYLIYNSTITNKQNVYEKVRGISGGICAIILGIALIFDLIEFWWKECKMNDRVITLYQNEGRR